MRTLLRYTMHNRMRTRPHNINFTDSIWLPTWKYRARVSEGVSCDILCSGLGSHTVPEIRCLSWKKKNMLNKRDGAITTSCCPCCYRSQAGACLGLPPFLQTFPAWVEPYVWSLNAPSVLGTRVNMFFPLQIVSVNTLLLHWTPLPIILFFAGFFPRLAAWNTLRYPWSPTMMGHDGALHSLPGVPVP